MNSSGLSCGGRPDCGGSGVRIGAVIASITMLLSVAIVPRRAGAAAGSSGHARLPTASETVRQKLKPEEESIRAHEPTYVSGRTLTYDSKLHLLTLSGGAKVTEGQTTLTADTIQLLNRRQVHALGHVHLSDASTTLVADEGTLDLDTEEASWTHGKVCALDNSYYLTGSTMRKTLGQNYHVENGNLTTCTCDSNKPDWSLTGKQMDLHVNGEMKATGGYFDVLGHSILPLPYLEYNTDPERHSGFLSPQAAYSTLRGFYTLQPYYFDLGPNQDITVAGDVETSARIGGLFEYRRVDSTTDFVQFTSSFFNESIRSEANRLKDTVDPQVANPTIPINRWGVVGLMEEHLTPDLFAYATGTSSGDNLFFRETAPPVLSGVYGWNSGTW